jgi:hypothetical protein
MFLGETQNGLADIAPETVLILHQTPPQPSPNPTMGALNPYTKFFSSNLGIAKQSEGREGSLGFVHARVGQYR